MIADPDVPPLHVRVMGVTVAIQAPDEETRTRLAHQWSRAVVLVPEEGAVRTIQARPTAPKGRDAFDYALATDVTMAGLVATTGRRLNFHAGGLGDADGRVLAVVGPSGAGKTTATRLLATRLAYLSDETVSLEPDGRVLPHPKPLSVVTDGSRPRDKRQLSPDDLGLLPTPPQGRLARFLVLRRGVPDPRGLVQLETVEGLLELVEQSSSLDQLPDPLATLVGLIQGIGGVWALEYDEIADHLDEVVRLLDRDIAATTGPEPVRHPGRAGEPDRVDGALVRTPWVDAIEIAGEVVVLVKRRAIRLDHLMATVWLELDEPRTVPDLVAAAEARHGVHPDAPELVCRAIDTLVDEGLVVRGSLA